MGGLARINMTHLANGGDDFLDDEVGDEGDDEVDEESENVDKFAPGRGQDIKIIDVTLRHNQSQRQKGLDNNLIS